MERPLEVGDRVRVRTCSVVPAGTLGYISFILFSAADIYFVRFDGHNRQTLLRVSDLELVTEVPADEDAL